MWCPDRTPQQWNQRLLEAAGLGCLRAMEHALENGRADVNTHTGDGATPFLRACENGQLEAVRLLSTVPGIRLNAVDRNQETAFHRASKHGRLEVVRFLMTLPGFRAHFGKFGAIHATNRHGRTGLHLALISGHLPVVRFLLSSNLGFDSETRDGNSFTALQLAIVFDRVDIVEYLVTVQNADMQATASLDVVAVFTWLSKVTVLNAFGTCWQTFLWRRAL